MRLSQNPVYITRKRHSKLIEKLSGKEIHYYEAEYCNLSGSDFSNSRINEFFLKKSNLTKANLSDSSLGREGFAYFQSAILKEANLSNSVIGSSDFNRADCRGAIFRDVEFVQGLNDEVALFQNTNLEGADFRGSNISEIELINCNIAGAVFDSDTEWAVATLHSLRTMSIQFVSLRMIDFQNHHPHKLPEEIITAESSGKALKLFLQN